MIRDGATAVSNGWCGDAPGCTVVELANDRALYLQTKYSPSGMLTQLDRVVRERTLEIVGKSIDSDIARIQADYGADAPVDISWADFPYCLWNPDGSPGGPLYHKYIGRPDIETLGYAPKPIVGGSIFGDAPAEMTQKMPVWLDTFANPGLAAIFIFFILLVIFAALIRSASEHEAPAHAPEPDPKR